MDEAVKGRWISALRSGDYDQTTGQLADGQGGFCCLGVLCNLLEEDGIVTSSQGKTYYSYKHYQSSALLPGDLDLRVGLSDSAGHVFKWSEIKDLLGSEERGLVNMNWRATQIEGENVEDVPDGSNWSLANLNDSGVSFDTIAKIIEVKL